MGDGDHDQDDEEPEPVVSSTSDAEVRDAGCMLASRTVQQGNHRGRRESRRLSPGPVRAGGAVAAGGGRPPVTAAGQGSAASPRRSRRGLTRAPKTRLTASRTRNLLPNRTAQSRTAARTLPIGVEAWRNRALTRFLAATTTSSTPLSRTAVRSERVKVSLSTWGRYSTNRFRTTT